MKHVNPDAGPKLRHPNDIKFYMENPNSVGRHPCTFFESPLTICSRKVLSRAVSIPVCVRLRDYKSSHAPVAPDPAPRHPAQGFSHRHAGAGPGQSIHKACQNALSPLATHPSRSGTHGPRPGCSGASCRSVRAVCPPGRR